MHRLVPNFILRQFNNKHDQGTFSGITLFVDVSGFTAFTEAMLQREPIEADVLAASITRIFTPLQETIQINGGFIAYFAGDAFMAVFPLETSAPVNALRTASRIRSLVAGVGGLESPVDSFKLHIRLGMAFGEIEWGILRGELRSVYYFRGEAIENSTRAENLAVPGEWIISPRLLEQVHAWVDVRPVSDYWVVTSLHPAAQRDFPPANSPADLDSSFSADALSPFFPPDLIAANLRGEFRRVVSIFLNIQGNPGHAQLQELIGRFLPVLDRYGGYLCRLDFGENGCRLLLFWGAPHSTGKNLECALNFLLMAKNASTVPVRAGVTDGIAYAGFVGAARREEYTCYSSRVNLAARLMSAAHWGEIWLGEECALRSRQKFLIKPAGLHNFKGFAEPYQVHCLLSAIP